jgi:phospholipid/cholesterol/gamma-HCH transport system substrate-binding protein
MDTDSSKFKVKLGLFVAGGLTLFVIAIFLIGKQKNLFNPVFKLTTSFYNVGGLQVGNNIRFSGINVGTVGSITLINDTTVQVDMIIKKSVQKFIKTDCQAAIGSEGIVGDRVLIITQGSSAAESVKGDEYIISVEPVEIDGIIKTLNVTATQMAEIMININRGNGTLGRLIRDSTISENINKTIINLRKSSKGLDENMQAAKGNFLFKGYFNKKTRQAQKAKQDSIKLKKEESDKAKPEKKN